MQYFRCSVGDGGSKEDEAAGRVREVLAREAYSGYPLVPNENTVIALKATV